MSTNIHDILATLQRAADDAARIPQLEAQLKDALANADAAQRHSQALELKIAEYHGTIDALQAKLRSVEAERDDAGFRHLEAEDRLANSVRTLTAVRSEVDDLLGILSPAPTPEPTPAQTEPTATPEQGTDTVTGYVYSASASDQFGDHPEPVSEPVPLSSPPSLEEAKLSADPQKGQFHGMRFWETPPGVTYDEFLREGGVA